MKRQGRLVRGWFCIFLGGFPVAVLGSGCDERVEEPKAVTLVTPQPIGHSECAACGMVVREQPAPRIQVVHRDGERAYFCSIGDSLHYLADKNSHGEAAAVYVEVLESVMDPQLRDTDEKEWLLVSETAFVTGVARSGIMGEPVLSFRSVSAAEEAAKRHGGAVATWADVQRKLLSREVQ